MFERELRDLCHVPRWNILRRSRQQNVAEHMYFVTIYALEIATFIEWEGDHLLLARAALTHDIPEVWTGDPPGPAKHTIFDVDKTRTFEDTKMREIFPEHFDYFRAEGQAKAILRVADRLDATLFLADEWNMGNRSVGSLSVASTPFGSNKHRLMVAIEFLPCSYEHRVALKVHVNEAIMNAMEGVSRIHTEK